MNMYNAAISQSYEIARKCGMQVVG